MDTVEFYERVTEIFHERLPKHYSIDKIKPWAVYIWREFSGDELRPEDCGEAFWENVFDISDEGIYIYEASRPYSIETEVLQLALEVQAFYKANPWEKRKD